jgi:hypothetical protein
VRDRDRDLRSALLAVTDDGPDSNRDVSFAMVASDETQTPAPEVILVRRRLARAGSPPERRDESSDADNLHVGPSQQSLVPACLDVAPEAAGRSRLVTDQGCPQDGGVREDIVSRDCSRGGPESAGNEHGAQDGESLRSHRRAHREGEDTPNPERPRHHGIPVGMSGRFVEGALHRSARGMLLLLAAIATACDEKPTKMDQLLEAGSHAPSVPPAPEASAADAASPAVEDAGANEASTWDGAMPPRPIPKPALTVGSGMPAETQMKAIAYMSAMSQPSAGDANAEPEYASALATQLKPITMVMDHGSAEDKLRLNRVEVVASGRRIDLFMADGCDARAPQTAVVQRAGVSFVTLQSHGVLVVRCNDSHVQCLQSTRDPSDVLCTTAPRHR